MVGLPSQLGYQIVDDVCKKATKLSGCCCSGAVEALWSDKLPVSIQAHISGRTFDHNTYKDVFEAADQCYLASNQVNSVAAMTAQSSDMNETLPAFSNQNQPSQVAAMRTNRGGGANRGSSGTARGGSNRGGRRNKGNKPNKPRGPRHSSSPPESCCERHYVHGADAWYCLAPTTCPWVSKVTPRP